MSVQYCIKLEDTGKVLNKCIPNLESFSLQPEDKSLQLDFVCTG